MSPRAKSPKAKKTVVKRVVKKKSQPAPPVQPDISKQIKEEFSAPKDIQKPTAIPQEKKPPVKEFIPVVYPTEEPRRSISIWSIGAVILFIVSAAEIMYIIYSQQPTYAPRRVVPTIATLPMQTPTVTPTNTPTPIEVGAYEIAILNASGKTGEAGRLKTDLEAIGLTVSYIGNASKRQSNTTIYLSPQTPVKILDTLRSAVNTFSETYTSQLPSSETADVVITIGSE